MKMSSTKVRRPKGMDIESKTIEDYKKMIENANQFKVSALRSDKIKKARLLKNKLKKQARLRRKKEAEALGDEAPPKNVPHTIESLREIDITVSNDEDKEFLYDLQIDEFASYFEKSYEPKVLVTTSHNPALKTRLFIKELCRLIPNATYFYRRQAAVKKMIEQALANDFTDILIVNEHNKEPCSLLVSHLPEGPTAFFRLSNVKLTKNLKRDWQEITSHRPEILLTNFTTRLGISVGRMLASLFHYDPQFKGRRVVTFHNQRDYIFVRHHRYEFKSEKKAALRILGPSFTLKLKSLQKGLFDSKTGEYEWIVTNKRHEIEKRRRFFL